MNRAARAAAVIVARPSMPAAARAARTVVESAGPVGPDLALSGESRVRIGPARSKLLDAGPGWVLLRERGEYGEHGVAVYELVERPG